MAKNAYPAMKKSGGMKEGSPKEEAFDKKMMMAGKGGVGKKAPSPTLPSKSFKKK